MPTNEKHFIHMAIEHDAKINVLEERFESHSERWDLNFDKILKEIDLLKREAHQKSIEALNWRNDLIAKVNKLYLSIIVGLIGLLLQIILPFFFLKR